MAGMLTNRPYLKLLLPDDISGNKISVVLTFAQHIYNDNEVNKHFDIKAWVCVSHEFGVFRITKII